MFDLHRRVDPRDPDASLVATFVHRAVPNRAKSAAAGRPIYDDVEMCEIRIPGSRDMKPFPATEISHWVNDPQTGELRSITYAERFSRQYRQFKENATQTKSGTPLEGADFLTEARRAELRALNIYTVEQLAAIDGQELKNLGPGGRDFKNQAVALIEEAKLQVPNIKLAAELEAERACRQAAEEELAAFKRKRAEAEAQFDDMSNDDLRAYIAVHTGAEPTGQLPRKTLIRMAMDATPKEAVA